MKTYVELGLAALLAVLVYGKPEFLTNAANTTLGKVVMIVAVGVLAKLYGINSGIIAAIIVILLQDHSREGLSPADLAKQRVFGLVTTAHMDVSGAVAVGGTCKDTKDCGTCSKTCKNKIINGSHVPCACESTCEQDTVTNRKKCVARCAKGACVRISPKDQKDPTAIASRAAVSAAEAVQLSKHGTGADYAFTNLQPSAFPVTGTDQITLSRKMKTDAISATVLASQQANGCTNNGY